jgi:hypothetical protein
MTDPLTRGSKSFLPSAKKALLISEVLGSWAYEKYEQIVVALTISGAFKMTLKLVGMNF